MLRHFHCEFCSCAEYRALSGYCAAQLFDVETFVTRPKPCTAQLWCMWAPQCVLVYKTVSTRPVTLGSGPLVSTVMLSGVGATHTAQGTTALLHLVIRRCMGPASARVQHL